MKAPLPSEAAPTGIATDDDGAPGVGDGTGDGAVDDDEYPPPQAAPQIRINDTHATQNDRISTLRTYPIARLGEIFPAEPHASIVVQME
jgi:hypothetical protein